MTKRDFFMSNVLSYKENDVIVGKTHATKIDYHKYVTVAKKSWPDTVSYFLGTPVL